MEPNRFARLTLAFSKKLANLKASVALHCAHYNFLCGCTALCAARLLWRVA